LAQAIPTARPLMAPASTTRATGASATAKLWSDLRSDKAERGTDGDPAGANRDDQDGENAEPGHYCRQVTGGSDGRSVNAKMSAFGLSSVVAKTPWTVTERDSGL
jgi:hypothetical protein